MEAVPLIQDGKDDINDDVRKPGLILKHSPVSLLLNYPTQGGWYQLPQLPIGHGLNPDGMKRQRREKVPERTRLNPHHPKPTEEETPKRHNP